MCGSSLIQRVQYEIPLSPKELVDKALTFIEKNDKRAYNQMNRAQLKAHLVHSAFADQLRMRLTVPPCAISGVATWEFRHKEREIYIVGVVGDHNFLSILLEMWRTKYPFYSITYFRKGVRRLRKIQHNFNHN